MSPALDQLGDAGLELVLMSERELQRIEVLSRVIERRMTTVSAAHVLALSVRQVQRLLKTFQSDAATAFPQLPTDWKSAALTTT